MNNFNYQLAYHLFPNISTSQSIGKTKIIKKFALKNNFPYKSFSHELSTFKKEHY